MNGPRLAFSASGAVAVVSWLALSTSLFLSPPWRSAIWTGTSIAVPGLIGVAYAILIGRGLRSGTGGGFGSIEAVRRLFGDDAALAAGWLHYIAFDLFVGTWIAAEGLDAGASRLLVLPCLLLTFLFGPLGLLVFLMLRLVLTGRFGVTA